MLIADQLSRAIPDNNVQELEGDYVLNDINLEEINALEHMPISQSKIKDIQQSTEEDATLQ